MSAPGANAAEIFPPRSADPDLFQAGRLLFAHEARFVAGASEIAGVPRGMEQRIKVLTLDVTPAGAIQHMRLEELDGATTEFAFTQVEENIPTRDSDFSFTPPKGISVVDALPPI